jgi:hypothetical protein
MDVIAQREITVVVSTTGGGGPFHLARGTIEELLTMQSAGAIDIVWSPVILPNHAGVYIAPGVFGIYLPSLLDGVYIPHNTALTVTH